MQKGKVKMEQSTKHYRKGISTPTSNSEQSHMVPYHSFSIFLSLSAPVTHSKFNPLVSNNNQFLNSLYLSITTVIVEDRPPKRQTWSMQEKLLETNKILSKWFKGKLLSLVNVIILLQNYKRLLIRVSSWLPTKITIYFMILAGYSAELFIFFQTLWQPC